jgi:CDP-diacylglycerol--glycerol-3-phosphate 3-phosphatidyltransferase/cardiolipin synthase
VVILNIPNTLTLLRILLIPVLVLAFYLPVTWSHLASACIFTFAAVTDGLDGWLARRLGQTSALGAFLDPVADKLMIAVALVLLVERHPTPWLALPAAVIIGREITISALREWMAELGDRKRVAVSGMGKLKTIVQMVALVLLLLHDPVGPLPVFELGMLSLYLAAGLTLWSMLLYLHAAYPRLIGKDL